MPAGDAVVSLVIQASARGLTTLNRQIGALQKRLMGFANVGKQLTPFVRNLGGGGAVGGGVGVGFARQVGQFKALTYQTKLLTHSSQNLSNVTRGNVANLVSLGANSRKASDGLRETGRQSYYAGMMLTRMGYAAVALSAAIVGLGIASVKTFATFQANLVDIGALAGLTDKQIASLGEEMRTLSKSTLFSATEISKAGVALARTGIIATHGFEAYNAVMKASIILTTDFWRQGVTLEQSVETTTRTLRQFGLEASDSGRIVNALAAGSAFTLAKITDLQKGLSYAGAAAKSMGVSLEETITALGMLANVGITAGRAGRQFRNIMVRLGRAMKNPTKAQKEVMEASRGLKVELSELNVEARGLPAVLVTLKGALTNVAAASSLVRMRAAVAVLILAKQSGEFEKLKERIISGRKAFEMYDAQMSTLLAKWKVFTNNVQALAIVMGSHLEPIVSKLLDIFTKFIQSLDDLSPAQQKLILVVAAFTALSLAISGVVLVIKGFLMSAMFGWKKLAALAVLAVTQWAAVTGIILTSVAAVALFVAGIAAGRVMWKRWQKTGTEAAVSTNNNLTKLSDNVIKFAKNWTKAHIAMKRFPSLMARANQIATKEGISRWSAYWKALGEMWQKEPTLAEAIAPAGVFDALESISKKSGNIAAENFKKEFVDELKLMLDETMTWLKEAFPDAAKKIDEVFGGLVGKVGDLSAALNVAGAAADSEMERISGLVKKLAGDTSTIITNISKTWSDTIFDLIKGATTFREVWQQILDDALRNFIHGFVRGMLEGWSQTLGKMVADYIRAQYFMAAVSTFLKVGTSVATPSASSASFAGESFALKTSPSYPTMAAGGIVRRPTLGLVGEAGPEAVVPLDEYNGGGGFTIINVVDPNFVNSQIMQHPDAVINVINSDLINGGVTRRTIKRVK